MTAGGGRLRRYAVERPQHARGHRAFDATQLQPFGLFERPLGAEAFGHARGDQQRVGVGSRHQPGGQVDRWSEEVTVLRDHAAVSQSAARRQPGRLRLGVRHQPDHGIHQRRRVAANESGRLFALAGDRVIRPNRNRFTLAEAAEQLGVDEQVVRRAWRAYGLILREPSAKVASPDDVEALRTHLAFVGFFGEDAGTALARVVASAMSRVGEALSTTVRASETLLDIAVTGSEPVTARAFADAAQLVPYAGRLIAPFFRHHLESARSLFEQAVEADPH